jgi:hypothetical protein
MRACACRPCPASRFRPQRWGSRCASAPGAGGVSRTLSGRRSRRAVTSNPVWRYAARRSHGAQRLVVTQVGALRKPRVHLQLEVELVGKTRPRLEKLFSIKSCSRSTTPLAYGSAGSQKYQSTRSCPQNAASSCVGATLAGVQPGLVIPDQQLSKRAQRREDQRASTGARVVPTPECGLCSGGEGFEPSWTPRSPRCARSTLSGPCLLSSSDGSRSVP